MLDLAVQRGFGRRVETRSRTVHGGSVVFCPAPNGTVCLTGLGARGEWIAEYRCLAADYTDAHFERMAKVVEKKARKLELVTG